MKSFDSQHDPWYNEIAVNVTRSTAEGAVNFQEIKTFSADTIREEFRSRGLEVKTIVLFGSQSRGTAGPDSDWDFLVGTTKNLEFKEKARLITAIQRRLAVKRISADIIIKSENKIEQEKNNVGVITYYALKDGVAVWIMMRHSCAAPESKITVSRPTSTRQDRQGHVRG